MNDSMKNKCKDNFAVLSGRNNSFDWKKLLFHAGGTFVSTRRNFCFVLVELLFRLEETFVFCWWNFCLFRMKQIYWLDKGEKVAGTSLSEEGSPMVRHAQFGMLQRFQSLECPWSPTDM